MNLVQTKGCKRCGGDLFLETDIYDGTPYIFCLQCSAVYHLRKAEKKTGHNLARDKGGKSSRWQHQVYASNDNRVNSHQKSEICSTLARGVR